MKKQLLLLAGFIGLFQISGQAQSQIKQTRAKQELTVGTYVPKNTKSTGVKPKTTAIWGAESSVGVAHGKFANDFINASGFAVGANPNDWTALSGTNAYWTRSTTGESQGAYWGAQTALASPSMADGVALFDSDYLDNNGVIGAFGSGTSPGPHRGELISPRIDLTGYSNKPIAVKVYIGYREYDIDELSISMSNNDAASWTTIDVRNEILSEDEGFILIPFHQITNGVSDMSTFRIKITFDGYYYYAMADDISIIEAPLYDLAIPTASQTSNLIVDQGDQIHITGNRYFPLSHLNLNHHGDYGANVTNKGLQSIEVSDSCYLILTVEKSNEGEWEAVFNNRILIDTVPNNERRFIKNSFNDFSWASLGDFRATYTIGGNIEDGNPDNNTISHEFTLTPNNYASLVGKDDDDNPQYTDIVFPGGENNYISIEFGSLFYFNDPTSEITFDSLKFKYYVTSNFNGLATQTYYAKIYEVNPSTNITIEDKQDLTVVGISAAEISGLGTTIPKATFGTLNFSTFMNPNTGGPMAPINGNKHYYIAIDLNYIGVKNGQPFSSSEVLWFGTSNLKNYYLNLTSITQNKYIQPSTLFITDEFGTENNNWLGFGADIIPSIGLHISSSLCAYTEEPVVDFNINTTGKTISCSDASVSQSNNVSWLWDFGDGNTSTEQNPTHVYATDNTYTVCLTVTDDCISDSTCAPITISTVDIAENGLDNLNIYPVPTKDILNLVGLNTQETYNVSIVNQLGQQVFAKSVKGNSNARIDVNQLNPGTYQLLVVTAQKSISRNIVIVE